MDRELIILKERNNDGSHILFFQEEISGAWITYGYSAYHLSQMYGINVLSSFSDLMQMPCVCISNADFKKIAIANMKIIEVKDGCYQLPMDSNIELDSYQTWSNSLK